MSMEDQTQADLKRVVFMRHGEAAMRAPSDALRELTPRGIEQATAASQKLSEWTFDVCLVSPYVRAQQTALTVREQLPYELMCEVWESITPDGDAGRVLHDLEARPESCILVVTHQPLVGTLVNLLESGTVFSQSISTAECIAFATEMVEPGMGTIVWREVPY